MRSKTKSNVFASDSSERCDVELKCLFGAALIGWGLGHKIRCIFSLGLLEDWALLKKARLTDLISFLILLRTSRNLFQKLAKFVLCANDTY